LQRDSIGFGIAQSIDPTRSRARLAELCDTLRVEIGPLFIPRHPASYKSLVDAFLVGEISVAWLPPIACSELVERGRALVLALPVRRGSISYRSALIARRGAVAGLGDLRGRTVAWVDPDSSSGYLIARLMLHGAGLDLSTLFAAEQFVMSHAAVVGAVSTGRCDVGATYCSAEGEPHGPWVGASAVPIAVLATSGAIPNDAIVVSTGVSVDVRAKLLRWLLELRTPQAKKLCADLFAADSFRVAAKEHYEPLRRMLLAAEVRGRASVRPPRSE
jgi:phosphonate transport system substrate-binding protein